MGKNLVIKRACSLCPTVYTMEVDPKDWGKYLSGQELIQVALPYLAANEREMLISGICGGCFDALISKRKEKKSAAS